ncbi:MAG: two-component system NtrC family sensor kinase [Flavobacteriales bacterium]|jgi:two-component system NtrC family sensor kinase
MLMSLVALLVATVALFLLLMLTLMEGVLLKQGVSVASTLAEIVSTTVASSTEPGQPFDSEQNEHGFATLCELFARRAEGARVAIVAEGRDGPVVLAAFPGDIAGDDLPAGWRESLRNREVLGDVRVRNGVRLADAFAPIIVGDEVVGGVRFELPLRRVQEVIRNTQKLVILYVVFDALFLLMLGYFVLTRRIVRPISTIMDATTRVAGGDLNSTVEVNSANELGALARNFERMVASLREGRDELNSKIEALAETNAALERAQQEVVRSEKLATLGTLSAGIAHEVGNPIAAMTGLLELLHDIDELPPETARDLVSRVEAETARISRIVQELLDYARVPEAGAEPDTVDAAVEQAVSLCSHHPRASALAVRLTLVAEERVAIATGRLVQVLLNLLVNAADAIGESGVVQIETRDSKGGVEIRVRDDGPGFDHLALPRVFDPFFTTKKAGQGTGLGLAICDRIIGEASGTIRAVNADDGGAEFVIWLPSAE